MIRLGVNIDHVATLRQARRGRIPELVAAAHAANLGGADLITVHLREDRRHVQDDDVELLLRAGSLPVNLEIAATDEMVAIARRLRPASVCLVPERREELTTEGGLDVRAHAAAISSAVAALRGDGLDVSLFVGPDEATLLAVGEVGADAVELHTGTYANASSTGEVVRTYIGLRDGARLAKELGYRVHAGHGLDTRNVGRVAGLPEIEELNIGFAIVARAMFVGLAAAVREMRHAIDNGRETAVRERGALA
jgi:pyridoxine 5-phosphate synthase